MNDRTRVVLGDDAVDVIADALVTHDADTPITRKWRMTRFGAGDYMLPSNDRQTMWRIWRYEEDGNAFYVNEDRVEVVIRGHYWSLWKWNAPYEALREGDWDEWDERWQEVACLLPTRQAAIDAAMGYEVEVAG